MKYLHIFYNDKFAEPYISFINENFATSEHLFLFFGGVSEDKVKITKRGNVYKFSLKISGILFLLKVIYKSEKIIIHSLYNKLLVLLLFLQPWLLKKSNWIVWGGDLYYYKKRKKNLLSNIYELFRRYVIKNLSGISTLVRGDYDLAKEWYNTKAKYYKAIYMSEERTGYLEKIADSGTKDNDIICIQIGNSASPSNNHIEILELLEKYKNENIKIFCPLSYGDAEYAKKVIEYGKQIYGDKFIPLEKLLSMCEYMDFLQTIDIGIFNNDRQQALGNIYSLLYLGKKVYLRNDTSMWNEINNELKLIIFSICQLKEEEFNSIVQLNQTNRKLNKEILKLRYDTENIKSLWEKIFI